MCMYKNPGLNPDWYNNWFWGCFNHGLNPDSCTCFLCSFLAKMHVFCLSLLALVGEAWGCALEFRPLEFWL